MFKTDYSTAPAAKVRRLVKPADERTPHVMTNGNHWKYNSDFAFLEFDNSEIVQKLLKYPYPSLKISGTVVEQETVFVLGIPGNIDENLYLSDTQLSYSEFSEVFFLGGLNVSSGVVTKGGESVCYYDANTARGMSGGPVFAVRNGELVLIGIHIGGDSSVSENMFIPFTFPPLSEQMFELKIHN